MNCKEFDKKIFSYLFDGDLDQDTKSAIEEHFFECDDCFDTFELFRTMTGVLQKEGVENLLNYSKKDFKKLIHENAKRIVGQLKQFVSATSFPVLTHSYHTVRGEVSTENHYTVGEKITISIKTPHDIGGYLTVLHLDDDNGLKLIFPNETSMEDRFFKPSQKIKINVEAMPPFGTHVLKVFLTNRKIFQHDYDSVDKEIGTLLSLIKFYDKLSSADKKDWMISTCKFEVVET
jgi:Domain of unknown function (DUF4384)/Putative zinc-finger